MKKISETVKFILLAFFFLLCSIRYYDGNAGKTFIETGKHILTALPLSLGVTLLIYSLFNRLLKEKLPFDRVVLIFFTAAIFFEFLYALNHYITAG